MSQGALTRRLSLSAHLRAALDMTLLRSEEVSYRLIDMTLLPI